MKNNSDNFSNIKKDEKENFKMNDATENQIKLIRNHCKKIKEIKDKKLKIKILFIILLSIIKLSFNSIKLDLS